MKNSNKIDVVFSIDENYIQHFCVAVTSLLENNQKVFSRIFLIHDIKNQKVLQKTLSFIYKKYDQKIICLNFDNLVVENFKVDSHISKATYYRLFLSDLLPPNVEKILYLDSDLIVDGSLNFLKELTFKEEKSQFSSGHIVRHSQKVCREFSLYAVNEITSQNDERLREIGLTGSNYFNAGVLLINLKKWREDRINKRLVDIALRYSEKLKFHDQDVLNIVFQDSCGELDYKFNTVNLEFINKKVDRSQFLIIHYTSGSKPWHFRNTHPLKFVYWEYLRKTPFRSYIPVDITFRSVAKKMVYFIQNLVTSNFREIKIP